jgi:hypothetical protein
VVVCWLAGGVLALSTAGSASAIGWQPLSVWHMDETSDSTMKDATGTSPGALYNVSVNQAGKIGRSYAFNGSSSYVSVSNSARLNPGTRNVRISISLKTTYAPNSGDWSIIRKGYYASGDGQFKVEWQPGGQVSCGIAGTNRRTELVSTGPSLANGAWHQVQCIKASTYVQLLVDGRSFRRDVRIGSITNSSPVIIGAYPNKEFFRGYLGEAKIEVG